MSFNPRETIMEKQQQVETDADLEAKTSDNIGSSAAQEKQT